MGCGCHQCGVAPQQLQRNPVSSLLSNAEESLGDPGGYQGQGGAQHLWQRVQGCLAGVPGHGAELLPAPLFPTDSCHSPELSAPFSACWGTAAGSGAERTGDTPSALLVRSGKKNKEARGLNHSVVTV